MLGLMSNDLSSLPSTITEINTIKTIDLDDNNFSSIPSLATEISSLQGLYLTKNNISESEMRSFFGGSSYFEFTEYCLGSFIELKTAMRLH